MLAGPDVSNYQGTIAWPRVRLSGHELAFAIAKSSEGTGFIDHTFVHNWHGIRERGLIRGAYHFATPGATRPSTHSAILAEATHEAEHMLSVLHEVGGIGEGDLPPVLDLEVSHGLDASQLYAWVDTWVHVVASHVGRPPIIYTGGFWKSNLNAHTHAFGCPLWLAQYAERPQLPRAWEHWTLWQFTDAGHVDGIAGHVDLSYFNGSMRELEELAGSRSRAHPGRLPQHAPASHAAHVPAAHHAHQPQHAHAPQPAHALAPHAEPGEKHAPAAAPPWPGRVLERGMHGSDVRQWQERMLARGFDRIRTDGVYDDHCATSCRWLQLYLRYPPTERVDEAVWHATWAAPAGPSDWRAAPETRPAYDDTDATPWPQSPDAAPWPHSDGGGDGDGDWGDGDSGGDGDDAPARRRPPVSVLVALAGVLIAGVMIGWFIARDDDSDAAAPVRVAVQRHHYAHAGLSLGVPKRWQATSGPRAVRAATRGGSVTAVFSAAGHPGRARRVREAERRALVRQFGARVISMRRARVGRESPVVTELAGRTPTGRAIRILSTATSSRWRTYGIRVVTTPRLSATVAAELRTLLRSLHYVKPRRPAKAQVAKR